MARKKIIKDIEEPIPMNTKPENFVVMSNDLVKGKSALSLNSAKLLRLTIMQSVVNENEFKPYKIGIQDFADFLDIASGNLYRDAQTICVQLLKEVVLIGDGNPKHKWNAFQWVTRCGYNNGTITIQLHDDMKPYILNLKKCYTQYEIDNILYLKSMHALRVYELIKMEMRNFKVFEDKETEIYLSMEQLRIATGTEKKYEKSNDFTKRVIKVACDEINERPFGVKITYDYHKEGRKIIGYDFLIKAWNSDVVLSPEKQARVDTFLKKQRLKEMGQFDIFDYTEYLPGEE